MSQRALRPAKEAAVRDAVQRIIENETNEAGGEETIKVEAPQEPEVNPEVYKDVEGLLFRGFLFVAADINGVRFGFKSLNHHEFEAVRFLYGEGGSSSANVKFYSGILAHSVFLVDGENVLLRRSRWLRTFHGFFSDLPASARDKMVRYVAEINRRARDAVTLAEAYASEPYSRFRWAQYRGLDLTSPACTGFPGTNRVGLNYAQLVWRALNHYEDQREIAEREWDNAKFIGSCFAGKEVQKIVNQDKERRRKERDQRFERKDALFRRVLLGEKAGKANETRLLKLGARTVEELASQLERDLNGEKDWHDQVIAAHEEKIRASAQARQEKLLELARAAEERYGDRRMGGYTDLSRGYTAEEVDARKRQTQAQKLAARVVYPELEDERMNQFLTRHGILEEAPYQAERGDSLPSTDLDPSTATPLTPLPLRPPPFRRLDAPLGKRRPRV